MNNSNRERKRLLDSYMENRLTVFFLDGVREII